jgi:hypothetical protein
MNAFLIQRQTARPRAQNLISPKLRTGQPSSSKFVFVCIHTCIGSAARFQVNLMVGSFTYIPDESNIPGISANGTATMDPSFTDSDGKTMFLKKKKTAIYTDNKFSISDLGDMNDSDKETDKTEEDSNGINTPKGDDGSQQGNEDEEHIYGKLESKPTVTEVSVVKH